MNNKGFSLIWVMVLVGSLVVNFLLFKALVAAKERKVEPVQVQSTSLRRVANSLGIIVSSDRSDADIEVDIKIALDDAIVAPSKVISKKELEEISTSLSQENYELLQKGCEFLERIKGEKVWILKGRDF
jgi:hypothetical protein